MAAIHGGTDEQAIAYCQKGGDFWQGGTRVVLKGRKERQGPRNDLEALKSAIDGGESYDESVFYYSYLHLTSWANMELALSITTNFGARGCCIR